MTEYAGYVPPEAQTYSRDIGVEDKQSDAEIAADATIITEADTPAISVPEGVEPQGLPLSMEDELINTADFPPKLEVETVVIEDETLGVNLEEVPEPPKSAAETVADISDGLKKSLEGMSTQMAA